MPQFKGTDFEIELPAGFRDESTYAFAFPARANFRPSIVVKTEHLAAPVELPVYVQQQMEKLVKMLPHVALVSSVPSKHGESAAHTTVYDWGDETKRVRQKQRYVLLPQPLRIVTLTGTGLRETFGETEALFDAIFLSFRATAPKGT